VDAAQHGGDRGGKPTSTGRREDQAVPVPGAPALGVNLVTHWRGQRARRGSVQVPRLWRDRVEEALEGISRRPALDVPVMNEWRGVVDTFRTPDR